MQNMSYIPSFAQNVRLRSLIVIPVLFYHFIMYRRFIPLTTSAFNTFWFRYIGQIVSYLFIFFISLPGAERHMRFLKQLNLVASAFLLLLMLLSPVLPPIPGVTLTEVLSGSRGVVCLAVFLSYYSFMYAMKTSRLILLLRPSS